MKDCFSQLKILQEAAKLKQPAIEENHEGEDTEETEETEGTEEQKVQKEDNNVPNGMNMNYTKISTKEVHKLEI